MSLELIYKEVGRLVVENGRMPTAAEYLHILLSSPTVGEVRSIRAQIQAGEIIPAELTETQRIFFDRLQTITVDELNEIRRRVQAGAPAAKLGASP